MHKKKELDDQKIQKKALLDQTSNQQHQYERLLEQALAEFQAIERATASGLKDRTCQKKVTPSRSWVIQDILTAPQVNTSTLKYVKMATGLTQTDISLVAGLILSSLPSPLLRGMEKHHGPGDTHIAEAFIQVLT
ncbi:MAG: hypothetical protein UZ21_OP11001001112 [Microgenomates bacterium OLB22]|nr:MAG: hypothetical protein UZ21_OP11001001112 [Microgenomates bacterium OLB22]